MYSSFFQFLLNKNPNFHDFFSLLFEKVFYSNQSSNTDFTVYRKPFLIVESGLSYFISNFELHTYLKNYENVEEKFYLIPLLTFSNFSLFLPNPPKIHFKIVETVPACLRHLCQFVREEGWLNRAKTSSKAETPWNQNNGLYCL